MKPRGNCPPKFQVGDDVHALWDHDRKWYGAVIKEVDVKPGRHMYTVTWDLDGTFSDGQWVSSAASRLLVSTVSRALRIS